MTKAKTFVLLLAVAALGVAAPLAQAATTTTLLEVPYGLGPSTNAGGTGRDNSIIAGIWAVDEFGMLLYDETHSNQGLSSGTRALKQYQHTYIADWDTAPMLVDIDVGGQLIDWGAYTPNYYIAIEPRCSTSVNDNGTPEDPLDDFVNPVPTTEWPIPGEGIAVNISSIWSTNDWYEGDGDSFANYNWSNPVGGFASTVWYAGDTLMTPFAIPWSFPGGGTGANAPYDPFPNCTLIETFHTLGNHHDFDPSPASAHGDGWDPSSGEPKTPMNSTTFVLDSSKFSLQEPDPPTPEDPLDDTWWSEYWEVQLDQAMMDDMFNNEDNRGLALWDQWAWIGPNGAIYSADQNSSHWPYIYARIEVLEGDANLDKAVDGLDYVAWSNNYNQAATWQTGDFNNDQFADGLDYVVWSNNYGATLPAAPGAVPEPATMALLAMGALALIRRRR